MPTPHDLRISWRKSSHSGQQGDCVELGDLGDGVAVRDSKNPTGPKLRFSRRALSELATAIKNERHNI